MIRADENLPELTEEELETQIRADDDAAYWRQWEEEGSAATDDIAE